ncbi:signal peptidase I [Ensifer sp. KUDG1]|uniref:signal peptidase I n=1 Tax=unclassified Ensifer TaxID=2633371 RepID=UPI0009DF5A48|nr:signal peptidase I [Ensifer sp. ZNC0028]
MKVLQAFRNRHPVCAALIGFFAAPALMMAYLGRWKLALAYFIAEVALYFGASWAIAAATSTHDATWLADLALVAFRCFGSNHGYQLARGISPGQSFPWYARWYGLALIFLVAPIAFTSLLFQSFGTAASSMYPTIRSGDYVVASKYAYGYGKFSFPFSIGLKSKVLASAPERGDVVVFAFPPQPELPYVKRVVGLPGDSVQYRGGTLYINGEPTPKEQVEVQHNPDDQGGDFTIYSERLSGDRFHRMAEDTPVSDTQEFTVPDGHYFMLGDNRNRSADSRHDVGFVPEENIFGKAVLVLYNKRSGFDAFRKVN